MPSDDQEKITGVNQQKITKAMKMVAAAKLRKAQKWQKGRPFSDKWIS